MNQAQIEYGGFAVYQSIFSRDTPLQHGLEEQVWDWILEEIQVADDYDESPEHPASVLEKTLLNTQMRDLPLSLRSRLYEIVESKPEFRRYANFWAE